MDAWLQKGQVFLRQYMWWVGGGLLSLSIAGMGAVVWYVPSLHSQGSRVYHQLARAAGIEQEKQGIVVLSPTADPVSGIKEQVAQLEGQLQQQKLLVNSVESQLFSVQDQLKQAIAEVAQTNDVLTRQQTEWVAALRRVGVASGAVPKTTASLPVSGSKQNTESAPVSSGKININTASLTELDSLPSIGPTYAQRIIDHRSQKGTFKTLEEIMDVSGIGQSTFDKIKDKIIL